MSTNPEATDPNSRNIRDMNEELGTQDPVAMSEQPNNPGVHDASSQSGKQYQQVQYLLGNLSQIRNYFCTPQTPNQQENEQIVKTEMTCSFQTGILENKPQRKRLMSDDILLSKNSAACTSASERIAQRSDSTQSRSSGGARVVSDCPEIPENKSAGLENEFDDFLQLESQILAANDYQRFLVSNLCQGLSGLNDLVAKPISCVTGPDQTKLFIFLNDLEAKNFSKSMLMNFVTTAESISPACQELVLIIERRGSKKTEDNYKAYKHSLSVIGAKRLSKSEIMEIGQQDNLAQILENYGFYKLQI